MEIAFKAVLERHLNDSLDFKDSLQKYAQGSLSIVTDKVESIRVDSVKAFSFGQSNPTFLIKLQIAKDLPQIPLVLRKTPNLGSGKHAVPGAHNMEREYRVQSFLGERSNVSVPKMIFLRSGNGSEYGENGKEFEASNWNINQGVYYIMEYVPGTVYENPRLRNVRDRNLRFNIYANGVRELAKLHKIPLAELQKGLPSLFKSGSRSSSSSLTIALLKRQVLTIVRVIQQQEEIYKGKHKTFQLQEIATWLINGLTRAVEQKGPASFILDSVALIHGDYKLDNMIFEGERVKAILDWELCALGHPLSDLAHFCLGFYLPAKVFNIPGVFEWSLEDESKTGDSLPSLQNILDFYLAERIASDHNLLMMEVKKHLLEHWNFFVGLELFKILMIFQGIAMRNQLGVASNVNAPIFEGLLRPTNELITHGLMKQKAKI